MEKQRMSRKELLKSEDAFLSVAHSTGSWITQHRRTIVAITASTALALGVGFGFDTFREKRAAQTAEMLAEGMNAFKAEVATDPTQAKPDAQPPVFVSEDAKRQVAKDKFNAVVQRGVDDHAIAVAQFYLGTLHAQEGNVGAAIASYDAAANALSPDDSLYFLAIERLANLKEQQGDRAGAVTVLARLVGKTQNLAHAQGDAVFYRDQAALYQAKLLAQDGKAAEARGVLSQLQNNAQLSDALKNDVQSQLQALGQALDAAADTVPKPAEPASPEAAPKE